MVAAGLPEVIMTTYQRILDRATLACFKLSAIPNYLRRMSAIHTWTEKQDYSFDFEENFLGHPNGSSGVSEETLRQGGGMIASERLRPIFHIVDSFTLGQDITDLMPSILVCLLMWPSKVTRIF